MPNYAMTIADMKWFNLFDKVPYKYVKLFDDEDEMDVEITDLPYDRIAWCKTNFKFNISYDVAYRLQPCIKTYNVERKYNTSSPMALRLSHIIEGSESESEDESESESESESEEEPQQ
jgi:hypothetical protein